MSVPTETLCPICDKIFLQPRHVQGGGRRKIYCSYNCVKKKWVGGNKIKRKAAVLKYDSKPENKEKKREQNRKATLARYNWTEERVSQTLLNQDGKCMGCEKIIDRRSARIDHHTTGQTMGLLCDNCNWGIGHMKDNPETLRKLAKYLQYHASLPNRVIKE